MQHFFLKRTAQLVAVLFLLLPLYAHADDLQGQWVFQKAVAASSDAARELWNKDLPQGLGWTSNAAALVFDGVSSGTMRFRKPTLISPGEAPVDDIILVPLSYTASGGKYSITIILDGDPIHTEHGEYVVNGNELLLKDFLEKGLEILLRRK